MVRDSMKYEKREVGDDADIMDYQAMVRRKVKMRIS